MSEREEEEGEEELRVTCISLIPVGAQSAERSSHVCDDDDDDAAIVCADKRWFTRVLWWEEGALPLEIGGRTLAW